MSRPAFLRIVSPRRGDETYFELYVSGEFAEGLEAAVQDGESTPLIIGRESIATWSFNGLPIPYLKCFGSEMGLRQLYLQAHPTVDVSASVTASVKRLPSHLRRPWTKRYEATIDTGAFRLITNEGFEPHRQLFRPTQLGVGAFATWLNRMWLEQGYKIAGLIFGKDDIHLELLSETTGQRRRVELLALSQEAYSWKLSSCGAGPTFETLTGVLNGYRERVTQALPVCGLPNALVVARQADDEAGAFYRRSRTNLTEPVTVTVRPDFAIRFVEGRMGNTWSPKVLREDGGVISLDTDEGANEGSDVATVQLNLSNGQNLTNAQLPTLQCVGARDRRLQGDQLWQFGSVDRAPACLNSPLPVWTRITIPDPKDINVPTDDNLLPIPVKLDDSNWQINLSIQPQSEAQVAPPRMRLELTPDAAKGRVDYFASDVTLFAPPLQTYTRRLQDPLSPPNEKSLAESTASARLVFATSHPQPTSSPRILIPQVKGTPNLVLHSELGGMVVFAPHGRDAGIDFLSAGATNLSQRVDSKTLRTIIERDTTHLLKPFPIDKATITKANEFNQLSVIDYVNADEQPRLDAAVSYCPWVSMNEPISADITDATTRQRSLYHRNLVLEHGEFASASLDRSASGRADGLAHSVEDFVNSVRDPYCRAIEQLPTLEVDAEVIDHWIPGAQLSNAPKSWIEYRSPADQTDRAPVVHLTAPFSHQLTPRTGVTDATHADWLTADVRLSGYNNPHATPEPTVEVDPINTNTPTPNAGGRVRARNGSVPILFDGGDFSHVAMDAGDTEGNEPDWVAAAIHHQVVLYSRASGAQIDRLESNSINDSDPIAHLATGRHGQTGWVLVVLTSGSLVSWTSDQSVQEPKWSQVLNESHSEFAVTAAASASGDEVACIAHDGNSLRLVIWTAVTGAATEVITDVAGFVPSNVVDWALLYFEDALYIAAAQAATKPIAFQGRRGTTGAYIFEELDLVDPTGIRLDESILVPARSISLAEFHGELMLGIVTADQQHWCLAELQPARAEFKAVDAVRPLAGDVPQAINLLSRPAAKAGLPVQCRAGWICVVNDGGVIDLWLSTAEPSLRSLDGQVSALNTAGLSKEPYLRLAAHDGQVLGLDTGSIIVGSVTRAGLISCGNDGGVRLWDVDTAKQLASMRSDRRSLDALGTLRDTTRERDGDHKWIQPVNRLGIVNGTEPEYSPFVESTSLTIAADSSSANSWLVQEGTDRSNLTEVYFCCEGLELIEEEQNSVKLWVPRRVPAGTGENAPDLDSQGYVGTFGFYSTIVDDLPALSYMARIAGVPMFIKDIVWMKLDPNVPGKIDGMKVHAVLINPLLVDGEGATLADIRQGDAPGFLTASLQANSIVEVTFANSPLSVEEVKTLTHIDENSVEIEDPIRWNLLIADNTRSDSDTEFAAKMEQIEFVVRYAKPQRRILLEVDTKNSSNPKAKSQVQALGGSRTVEADSLVLAGAGANSPGDPNYHFDVLWFDCSDDNSNPRLPFAINLPRSNFVACRVPARLLVADAVQGRRDYLSLHEWLDEGKGTTVQEILWWDTQTGMPRSVVTPETVVTQIAYGRGFAPEQVDKSQGADLDDVPGRLSATASSTAEFWTPHVATCDGTSTVSLYDLGTGNKTSTIQSTDNVDTIDFARLADFTTVLVSAANTHVQVWNVEDGSEVENLDHTNAIQQIASEADFAVVRGHQGLTFWKLGNHNTVNISLGMGTDFTSVSMTRWCDKWLVGGTHGANQLKLFVIEMIAGTWTLAETWDIDLGSGRDIEIIDQRTIAERPHLIIGVFVTDNGTRRMTQIESLALSPNGAVIRWQVDLGDLSVSDGLACLPHPGLPQVVTMGTDRSDKFGVSSWNLTPLLKLQQDGAVHALLDVDLDLSSGDMKFDVAAQVLLGGTLGLAKRTSTHIVPMVAGVARQGMYGLVADLRQPGLLAGRTSLVLWQEQTGLAGTAMESKQVPDASIDLSLKDMNGTQHNINAVANWTCHTSRVFGMGDRNSSRDVLSGRISATFAQQSIELHLTDQELALRGTGNAQFTAYLSWQQGTLHVQGPVVCQFTPAESEEHIPRVEMSCGVYRVSPQRPINDSVSVDYVLGEKGSMIPYNLGVATPTGEKATFLYLTGDADGIHWQEVPPDRIPVNSCLDTEVNRPVGVLPIDIPQLNHQQGLGRRLRVRPDSGNLYNGTPANAWSSTSAETIWLLQPMLISDAKIRVLDIGMVMQPDATPLPALRTENLLSVVRPATEEEHSVACLASATATPSGDQNLLSVEEYVSSANRRILFAQLLDDAASPVYRIIPNQGLALADFQHATMESTAEANAESFDSRLLTHAEAARLLVNSELERQIVPLRYSAERDTNLTALREFEFAANPDRRKLRRSPGERSLAILCHEGTAYQRMVRPWHLPESIASWGSDASAYEPFHPADLRLRLAPDKPGAMIHHRVQFAAATTANAGDPDKIELGPNITVAMREPMQLNPPLGSSITISTRPSISSANPRFDSWWRRLAFEWEEVLGGIQITAAGTLGLVQKSSDVEPQGVSDELQFSDDSLAAWQIILQINDQLVEVGTAEPLLPVYDGRQAANSTLTLDDNDNEFAEAANLTLSASADSFETLPIGGGYLFAAQKQTEDDAEIKIWWSSTFLQGDDTPIASWNETAPTVIRLGYWGDTPVAAGNVGSRVQLFNLMDGMENPGSALTTTELQDDGNNDVAVLDLALTTMVTAGRERVQLVTGLTRDRLHFWVRRKDASVTYSSVAVSDAEQLRVAPSADSRSVYITVWKVAASSAQTWLGTLNEDAVLSTSVSSEVSFSEINDLATLVDEQAEAVVYYVARPDGLVMCLGSTGERIFEWSMEGSPTKLQTLTNSGRGYTSVQFDDAEDNRQVAIYNARTGRLLRKVNLTNGLDSASMVMLEEPKLACGQQSHGRSQLLNLVLAGKRPGNTFVVTEAGSFETQIDGFRVEFKDENGDPHHRAVTLTGKLVLLGVDGEELSNAQLSDAFEAVDTLGAAFELHRLRPKLALNWGAAAKFVIRYEGDFEFDSTRYELSVTLGPQRNFRLIPYSATSPKLAAVMTLDSPDPQGGGTFDQHLQRTLIFGDAASPTDGKGRLANRETAPDTIPYFEFFTSDKEELDVPLPKDYANDWRLYVACIKYMIDGQVLSDCMQV